jgi:hypothetical protein
MPAVVRKEERIFMTRLRRAKEIAGVVRDLLDQFILLSA